MASNFDETRFKKQVSAALDKVRTILETNRAPNIPEDVPHQYNDKYLLADGLANNAIAAQLTCLQLMGLSAKGMLRLKKWSNSRTVTLRLTATETCVFDRKVDRKVENATQHVTEYSGTFYNSKHTTKHYHEVTEYFWKFDNNYEIFIYEGNDPAEKVSLCSRSGSVEIMTGSDNTPKPKSSSISPIDVNISWLLQNITDQMVLNFAINRSAKSCHTPRRNNEIEGARSHFQLFYNWAEQVRSYFTGRLFPVETGHGYDLGKMTDDGIFIPVVPLFEETRAANVKAIEAAKGEEKTLVSIGETSGAMLSNIDVNNFLLEHKRSLEERLGELAKMYPAVPSKGKGKLISAQEANIVVSVMHLKGVAQHFLDGVDYVEHMLRKQLIAAIGKEVQPSDFTNYMRYHNRQLFRSEYEPSLFCYAVRRPEHYPEGTLSIESSNGDGQIPESILTSVCKADVVRPMYFSISAGIDIHFTGERYLHAWVSHQFSGDSGPQLKLTARARQFSCFMVLLGTIADEHQFLPSHAVIIQNKDDLKVPLSMEQIPTPKEFKDSIHSLSPEQQRFARAYRSMQLAQTLFAVCIIQIKPQLEKLLKLDNDSLTKEIKLTQDLLELFIKYQIPSDLISYAGPADAPPTKKVDAVKAHVAALNEMLEESRKREIQEAAQGRKYNGPKRKRQPNRDDGVVLPQFTRHFIKQSGHAQVQDKPALGPGDKISEGDVPALPLNYEPDYTKIPAELDRRFEQLDEDSALRPTILKIGGVWEKTSQEALLADPVTASLNVEAQEDERDRAFDLLDALSRSGCLSVDEVALHVVLAATHCFDKTLMDTVIQNNVNPIEKVERSTLIVAATIQNKPPGSLLREDQVERVKTYSPMLFSDAALQLTRPSVPLALEASHQPVVDVASKDKGKKPVKVVVA